MRARKLPSHHLGQVPPWTGECLLFRRGRDSPQVPRAASTGVGQTIPLGPRTGHILPFQPACRPSLDWPSPSSLLLGSCSPHKASLQLSLDKAPRPTWSQALVCGAVLGSPADRAQGGHADPTQAWLQEGTSHPLKCKRWNSEKHFSSIPAPSGFDSSPGWKASLSEVK